LLELLDTEMRLAFALCGVTRKEQLERSQLVAGQAVLTTDVWGAFPMLGGDFSAPPSPHQGGQSPTSASGNRGER
jgi:hypothetical protein